MILIKNIEIICICIKCHQQEATRCEFDAEKSTYRYVVIRLDFFKICMNFAIVFADKLAKISYRT